MQKHSVETTNLRHFWLFLSTQVLKNQLILNTAYAESNTVEIWPGRGQIWLASLTKFPKLSPKVHCRLLSSSHFTPKSQLSHPLQYDVPLLLYSNAQEYTSGEHSNCPVGPCIPCFKKVQCFKFSPARCTTFGNKFLAVHILFLHSLLRKSEQNCSSDLFLGPKLQDPNK